MPEPESAREKIEGLRGRLQESNLSADDKEFFSGILAASDQAGQEKICESDSILIHLRKQLTRAFCPGNASGFILAAIKIHPPPGG